MWVDGVHRRGKAANGNWRRKRKKERTKKQKVKRWSCACDQSAPSSATIIACTIHTTQRYILYSAKLTQSEWKKEGKNWSPYPRWTALSSDKWQLLSNDLKCVRERGKMHIPQCINNWLAVCSCTIESASVYCVCSVMHETFNVENETIWSPVADNRPVDVLNSVHSRLTFGNYAKVIIKNNLRKTQTQNPHMERMHTQCDHRISM